MNIIFRHHCNLQTTRMNVTTEVIYLFSFTIFFSTGHLYCCFCTK